MTVHGYAIEQGNATLISFLTQKINADAPTNGSAFPFSFAIKNNDGELIAGCNGSIIFGSIYTDQLWVHPDFRKTGLGRKLMDHTHDYGRTHGCRFATVSTMSFQNAQAFYEKLGYVVNFERHGYHNGASCFFLKKDL